MSHQNYDRKTGYHLGVLRKIKRQKSLQGFFTTPPHLRHLIKSSDPSRVVRSLYTDNWDIAEIELVAMRKELWAEWAKLELQLDLQEAENNA